MPGCEICGGRMPYGAKRYCGAPCRHRAAYLRLGTSGLEGPDPGIACERCRRWVPHPETDYGGYCSAGRWLVCRPLRGEAEPWEPMTEG